MKIGKYEFLDEKQADEKILGLGEEHNHTIVKLGYIVIENGVYDDDLNEIKPPILSDKYHIDVMWQGIETHPYGWKSYSVDLTDDGVHSFFGVDYENNKIK